MAARIDETTGKAAMAYAGEVPSHGLAQAFDSRGAAEQFLEAGGLAWSVELVPVFAQIMFDGETEWRHAEQYQATIRSDTRGILGVVGARYAPLQNRDAFRPVEEIVGCGAAVWGTAG